MRKLLPFEEQELKANKIITVYTDYPLIELGDTSGEIAPVRKVQLMSYDWNKYCCIKVDGHEFEVKSGYLYMFPNRQGDANVDPVKLMLSNKDYAALQKANRKLKSFYEITLECKTGTEVRRTCNTLNSALTIVHSKQFELKPNGTATDGDIVRVYLHSLKKVRRRYEIEPLLEMDIEGIIIYTSQNKRSILKSQHFSRKYG